MTDPLTAHVTMLAEIGGPIPKLLLTHGRLMNEKSPEHEDFTRGALGECYMNAGRALHTHPHLHYVEGYAVPGNIPFPMMHAWLVDDEGRVIDPTWEDGAAYFGMIIGRHTVMEITMQTGYWGILDNLWMRRDLYETLAESLTTPDLHVLG
jgi:hypothetical protein